MRKGDTRGNLRRFRAALRDIAPDLLVTSNWGSIEWAVARIATGVPHLHMEDGFGPEEGPAVAEVTADVRDGRDLAGRRL